MKYPSHTVLMYHFLYRTRQFKFRDGNDTHPVIKDKEMDDVHCAPSKCVCLCTSCLCIYI